MATPALSDEHLRALRFLARHRGGCSEWVLLKQGFTAGQLGHLVYARLAKLRGVSGRPKFLVKITAATGLFAGSTSADARGRANSLGRIPLFL
jgi:hypothetical protein